MPGLGYDEGGTLASYFFLTFLSLTLIPTTLSTLLHRSKGPKTRRTPLSTSSLARRQAERERVFGSAKIGRSKPLLSKKSIFLVVGWLAFAFLSYRIANSETVQQVLYDPFEILGISESLTQKQIKSAYKKLSIKFHPDKIKLGVNETMEDAGAKFVELTKAYKALTDDVVRENWLQHGNPDGVQQREEVVAIPKWVIENKNSGWILGVYGAIFGGFLPFFVGRWWFGTRKFTKDGALNITASHFFRSMTDELSLSQLIDLVGSASDLTTIAGGSGSGTAVVTNEKTGKSKKDVKVEISQVEDAAKVEAKRRGLEDVMTGPFPSSTSRLATALIYSHLLRLPLSPSLLSVRTSILLALPPILKSLLEVALAHNYLSTSLKVMHLRSYLAQAVMPGDPVLMQLPGVGWEEGKKAEAEGVEGMEWVEEWADLRKERRKEILNGLDEVDLEEGEAIVRSWPKLEIIESKFKVIGEKTIAPSAIVQCIFKLRLANLDSPTDSNVVESTKIVEVKKEKSSIKGDEDDDEEEEDEEEIETAREMAEKKERDESKTIAREEFIIHAPYWPVERPLRYWAMIADIKSDRIIVQPELITGLLPNSPPETHTLQFQAPGGAGLYTFQAIFVADGLVGRGEVRISMQLKVEEPILEEGEEDEEDDISEPDEDTIAGQMTALRGGKVKKRAEDEESEEESSDEDTPKRGAKVESDSSDSDSD